MIDPTILAAIPPSLQAEFISGDVYRVGMLLFRKGQSGIVSHLIETSAMAPAASHLIAGGPFMQAANIASGAVGQVMTNVQLHQVNMALSTLKSLQLTNIATSGMTLGFAMVSHQLMTMRLDRVEQKIQDIHETLDRMARQISDLQRDIVVRDFTALRTACEQADNGWLAANPEREWRKAEKSLHALQNLFADKVGRMVSLGADIDAIEPFAEALCIAQSTRISCLIAAGELDLAHKIATQSAEQLSTIFRPIGTENIIRSLLKPRSIAITSPAYVLEAEKLIPFAREKCGTFRDREDVAATRPATILRLQQLGLEGREFLERARAEKDEPLLMLQGETRKAK